MAALPPSAPPPGGPPSGAPLPPQFSLKPQPGSSLPPKTPVRLAGSATPPGASFKVPQEILSQIPLPTDRDFSDKVKIALAKGRDRLPPQIKKIHDVVVKSLELTGKTEVTKYIELGLRLEKLQNSVDEFLAQRDTIPSEFRGKVLDGLLIEFETIGKDLSELKLPENGLKGKAPLFTQLDMMRHGLLKAIGSDLTTRSAALKGKAYENAAETIQVLHQRSVALRNAGVSAQTTFLPKGEDITAMFKGDDEPTSKRAHWEERTAVNLGNFWAPEAVLASFPINRMSPLRLGEIPLSQLNALEKGHSLLSEEIHNTNLKNALKSKVRDPDMQRLATQLIEQEASFQKVSKKEYAYHDGTNWITVPFVDIRKLLDAKKIAPNPFLKVDNHDVGDLQGYSKSNSDFQSALNLDPGTQQTLQEYIKAKANFDTFNSIEKYSYQETSVSPEQTLSFVEVRALILQGKADKALIKTLQGKFLSDGLKFEENFSKAVNFDPEALLPYHPFFSPNPEGEAAEFAICKSTVWEYSVAGVKNTISFDDLCTQWIQGKIPLDFTIRSIGAPNQVKNIPKENLLRGTWELQDDSGGWTTLTPAQIKEIYISFDTLPRVQKERVLREVGEPKRIDEMTEPRIVSFMNTEIQQRAFQNFSTNKWEYRNSAGRWEKIDDISKFQARWINGKIPPNTTMRQINLPLGTTVPNAAFEYLDAHLNWVPITPEKSAELQELLFNFNEASTRFRQVGAAIPIQSLSIALSSLSLEQLYPLCESMQWSYLDASNTYQNLSFKELQTLWLSKKIAPNIIVRHTAPPTSINCDKLTSWDLLEHPHWEFLDKRDGKYKVIDSTKLSEVPKGTQVRPIIEEGTAVMNLTPFEANWFEFFDPLIGKFRVVDLKTVYSLPPTTIVRPYSGEPIGQSMNSNLSRALEVPWKFQAPEVYQKFGPEIPMVPTKEVSGKSFVKMTPFFDLWANNRSFFNYLLTNLSPESERAILLTGQLQFLDLHSNNIGIIAKISPKEMDASVYTYSYIAGNGKLIEVVNANSKQFLLDLQSQKIKGNTQIKLTLPNAVTFTATMDGSPILKESVEAFSKPGAEMEVYTGTKVVLFDADHILAESNTLLTERTFYKDRTIDNHLIPLRSSVFGTPLQDVPLRAETIQALLRDTSVKGYEKMDDWIVKKDAQIRQYLPKDQTGLKNKLTKILSSREYSLDYYRTNPAIEFDTVTIENPQQQFVKDFTKITHVSVDLWNHLNRQFEIQEKEMSQINKPGYYSYVIKEEDLKKFSGEALVKFIAEKNGLTKDQLYNLNRGSLRLERNARIRIKPPVNHPGPESEKLRLSIAPQLFPRITARQHSGLTDRNERLNSYLTNYQELEKFKIGDTDAEILKALAQLEKFSNAPSSPFNSLDREATLKFIADLKVKNAIAGRDGAGIVNVLNDLKVRMMKLCKPTYGNVNFAMYPLLANANKLVTLLSKDNPHIEGNLVGLFKYPLEFIIEAAKKLPIINPAAHALALHLAKQMKDVIDDPKTTTPSMIPFTTTNKTQAELYDEFLKYIKPIKPSP